MASFQKDEPVMLASSVAGVIGYVLTLLVTRGILTNTESSTLSQVLLPLGAAILPLIAGAVARSKVRPVSKDAPPAAPVDKL